jgi:hypothetical protein
MVPKVPVVSNTNLFLDQVFELVGFLKFWRDVGTLCRFGGAFDLV